MDKIAIGLLMGICIPNASTAADGFDRYRVILERKPFGEPLLAPAEPVSPAAEAPPPWADAYRLCSVYEGSDAQVRVALLDLKTNKPVMLSLGSGPAEGIELLAADVQEEEARLRKDGETYTMKLQASQQRAKPAAAAAAPNTRQVRRSVTRSASQSAVQRAGAARRTFNRMQRIRQTGESAAR